MILSHSFIGLVLIPLASTPLSSTSTNEGDERKVVVTATTNDIRLSRIPSATSVIDASDLQPESGINLGHLLTGVPGVFFQSSANFAQDERISIRGFGSRSSFGIRGITIVVDGIPHTLPDGQSQIDSLDLTQVERLEVLRGPSSSFYGNSAGGVVHLVTRTGADKPHATLRHLRGADGLDDRQIATHASFEPLDINMSWRRTDYQGYRDHSQSLQDRWNGKLSWRIDEDSQLSALISRVDAPLAQDPGGITLEQATENPTSARDRNQLFDAGESVAQNKLGLAYQRQFSEQLQWHINGFNIQRDFDNKLPFVGGGQVDLERHFRGLHSRLNLNQEDSSWSLGWEWRQQKDQRLRFNNDQSQRGALVFSQQEQLNTLAAFAQWQHQWHQHWSSSVGLRYDDIELEVDDHFLTNGDDSGQKRWQDTSLNVGIGYHPQANQLFFANISSAFQTPTTTELANPLAPADGGGFNQQLEPERALNAELGMRLYRQPFDYLEVVLFNTRVKDTIIPFEVPDFSGSGRDFFRNNGLSTRRGLEISLNQQLTPSIQLTTALTHAQYKLDDFVTPDGNFSGGRLPGVPDRQFDIQLRWQPTDDFSIRTQAQKIGRRFVNNDNSLAADGYHRLNMTIAYRYQWSKTQLNSFVILNNITNSKYHDNLRINAFGGRYFEPAAERQIVVGFELTQLL
ncbi:TonB-dependent receptor [Pleionea sp. CnH1-48]|uniref:TonB-dependent receptor family protein n=1 Tax=Pleionea sp. CnH1-48 TaxID=2954494 RepID=UPI002096D9E9|nr:TonB-dependent receptor [Pleionea sp. CnH1-48]MCO7223484.1 TonB-dependent receptor [Pleionea sp. CnH1-48]